MWWLISTLTIFLMDEYPCHAKQWPIPPIQEILEDISQMTSNLVIPRNMGLLLTAYILIPIIYAEKVSCLIFIDFISACIAYLVVQWRGSPAGVHASFYIQGTTGNAIILNERPIFPKLVKDNPEQSTHHDGSRRHMQGCLRNPPNCRLLTILIIYASSARFSTESMSRHLSFLDTSSASTSALNAHINANDDCICVCNTFGPHKVEKSCCTKAGLVLELCKGESWIFPSCRITAFQPPLVGVAWFYSHAFR